MRTPPSLTTAALLLTGFACLATARSVELDGYSLMLLWPPLAALALLRRSRAAWGLLLGLSFFMAAFAALIAWKGGQRGSPAWFLEHFRWTALFWLTQAALLSARSSRAAVLTRALGRV